MAPDDSADGDGSGSDYPGNLKNTRPASSFDTEKYINYSNLTRRKLMALGVSISPLLAGCGGDGSTDPTATSETTVDTDTEPDETMSPGDTASPGETEITETQGEVTLRTTVGWNWPADETACQWGNPANFPGGYRGGFLHTPMYSNPVNRADAIPVLADGYPEWDECVALIKTKQNFHWADGTEVNALDNVWGHQVFAYGCCGGPDNVVWAAEPGDSKYVWRENKGAQQTRGKITQNQSRGLWWKRDIFQPLAEELGDASSKEEINEIYENKVSGMSLPVKDFEEHQNAYGLHIPSDWSADTLTMSLNEGHPFTDRTDIDTWEIQVAAEEQTRLQLINNNEVDIGDTSFSKLRNPPENLETYQEKPGGGRSISFNWRREHVEDLAFRRAIAHLMPKENIASVVSRPAEAMPVDVPRGPASFLRTVMGDEFVDNLFEYSGTSGNAERAAQILRNAGYSKDGGNWKGPDGNTVDLRLIAQTGSENGNVGSTVAGVLSNFGINTDFSLLEGGSYQQVFDPSKGDSNFDIMLGGYGVARLKTNLMVHGGGPTSVDRMRPDTGYRRTVPDCIGEPSEELLANEPVPDLFEKQEDGSGYVTWYYGIPITEDLRFPPVPTQVGKNSLSGQTMRPKIGDIAYFRRFAFPEEKKMEHLRNSIWWFNYYVPKVALYTTNSSDWYDAENWEFNGNENTVGVNDRISRGRGPHIRGRMQSK